MPSRRRSRHLTLTLSCLLFAVATAMAADPGARPGSAVRGDPVPVADTTSATAAQFLDSIGVNTHFSYRDTPYQQFDAVRSALVDLGVKHVRDNLPAQISPDYASAISELGAAGVRTQLTVGGSGVPKGGQLPAASDVWQAMVGQPDMMRAVDAVEGPNEWDVRGGNDWATAVQTFQCDLFRSARASEYADLPIVAPALSRRTNKSALGPLGDCADFGNDHLYPRNNPVQSDFSSQRSITAQVVSQGKPVMVTETGYTNALNEANAKQPVTDAVASVYIPRLFATTFEAGNPRTFLYELLDERDEPQLEDEEQHFGLLDHDLQPKPAYVALQRLIGLVDDSTVAADVQASPVTYSLDGQPADVHTIGLTRRDGTTLVLLWRDVSIDPLGVGTDQVAEPVTVRFDQSVAEVSVYRPSLAGSPVSTITSPNAVSGKLAADLVVLRVAPQGQSLGAAGPIRHSTGGPATTTLAGTDTASDAFATSAVPATQPSTEGVPDPTTTRAPASPSLPVVAAIVGGVVVLGVLAVALLLLRRRRWRHG